MAQCEWLLGRLLQGCRHDLQPQCHKVVCNNSSSGTVQVAVSEREPEDAALRRFRREVRNAKIVHEVRSCQLLSLEYIVRLTSLWPLLRAQVRVKRNEWRLPSACMAPSLLP